MNNAALTGNEIGLIALLGLLLFILSIGVRARTGGKYEIKTIDLVLVIMPLLVLLFITGRIQRFGFAGVEIETAQAFVRASEESIKSQVSQGAPVTIDKVVRTVSQESKAGVGKIPELIKSRTEALKFRLKHGGYWGPAIRKYFESLGAYSFLKYAIIYNPDGTLFGVYNARDLLQYFREKGVGVYDKFAKSLNNGGKKDREGLKVLPGFISADAAVTEEDNKRSVLEKMEAQKRETLPVVDSKGHFVGMVDRSRLVASLMIDIAKNLESRAGKN